MAEDYLNGKICPACRGEKRPGIILCLDCWSRTNDYHKKQLLIADVYAVGRRRFFYACIESGYKIERVFGYPRIEELEREPVRRKRVSRKDPTQIEFESTL